MGSILNFVSKDENTNGYGMFRTENIDKTIFNDSILKNYIDTFGCSQTFDYKILNEHKNFFHLECKEGIYDFYTKDIKTGKTILETLPVQFISELRNNKNIKILLTSLSESTPYDEIIFENIKLELKKFSIPNDKLIIIDSNSVFLNKSADFKVYTSYHFLHAGNIENETITDLKYVYRDLKETDVDFSKKRKYHFLCFNRNSQKFHRHFLILYLFENKIIDKCLISVLRELDKIQDDELSYLNKNVESINKQIPIEIDTQIIENKMGFRTIDAFRKKDYLNSYIHLVTETCYEENSIFFTEKIVKPIMGLQPFIVLSTVNYLKELKKKGFKTFDSIIDESYDDEIDKSKRLKKIFKEIERFSKMDIEELHEIYKSVIDICIYNKVHLLEISKKSSINETIKQIENEW